MPQPFLNYPLDSATSQRNQPKNSLNMGVDVTMESVEDSTSRPAEVRQHQAAARCVLDSPLTDSVVLHGVCCMEGIEKMATFVNDRVFKYLSKYFRKIMINGKKKLKQKVVMVTGGMEKYGDASALNTLGSQLLGFIEGSI